MKSIAAALSCGWLAIAAGAAALPITPVLTTATMTTMVAGSPMLEITKTCPKLRYVGRDATFEINVTNKGTGPASNVVVTDTLTGGVDFVSADNNGSRDGNNIVWRLGSLDAG